jgi:hypothetical protein
VECPLTKEFYRIARFGKLLPTFDQPSLKKSKMHMQPDTRCRLMIRSNDLVIWIVGFRHGANTVAANYGSGYAIEVMREYMEKAWD